MVYLFLADGFEEIEALTPLDILRRADIEIKTVGINSKTVIGAHGISVNCDTLNSEISFDKLDAIILPGGMPGALNLEKDITVQNAINFCSQNGLLICAICAAPQILGHKGLLKGKNAVCYKGFEKELIGAEISNKKVCLDGNIITACGAGAASEFGFKILEYLTNLKTVNKLKNAMMY